MEKKGFVKGENGRFQVRRPLPRTQLLGEGWQDARMTQIFFLSANIRIIRVIRASIFLFREVVRVGLTIVGAVH